MDEALFQIKPTPVPAAVLNQAKLDDTWGYIYTSGTTGLVWFHVLSFFVVNIKRRFFVCFRQCLMSFGGCIDSFLRSTLIFTHKFADV